MPAAVARSIREVSRRLAHAVAAERLAHTQIQNVGLARTDTHDSVTHHTPAYGHPRGQTYPTRRQSMKIPSLQGNW